MGFMDYEYTTSIYYFCIRIIRIVYVVGVVDIVGFVWVV